MLSSDSKATLFLFFIFGFFFFKTGFLIVVIVSMSVKEFLLSGGKGARDEVPCLVRIMQFNIMSP